MASFFFNLFRGDPVSPSQPKAATTGAAIGDDPSAAASGAARSAVADYCGRFDLRHGTWDRGSHETAPAPPSRRGNARTHPFSETAVHIVDLDAEFAALRGAALAGGPTVSVGPSPRRSSGDGGVDSAVRIVAISDTHQYHNFVTLPRGDILIHCGDILLTDRYNPAALSESYLREFFKWFNSQPHAHKLFIAGNHDATCFAMGTAALKALAAPAVFLTGEEIYDVCGLRVFGNSFSTGSSNNAAFQDDATLSLLQSPPLHRVVPLRPPGEAASAVPETAPATAHNVQRPPHCAVDVLVTHCHLPRHIDTVRRLNPGISLAGHYHAHHGLRRGVDRCPRVGSVRFNERRGAASCPAAGRGCRETDAFFADEVPVVNVSIVADLGTWRTSPVLHPPTVVDVVPLRGAS